MRDDSYGLTVGDRRSVLVTRWRAVACAGLDVGDLPTPLGGMGVMTVAVIPASVATRDSLELSTL